ncbi:hypothetical protein F5880DRAFT_1616443 [Lentinula raphanica]|nr:hypothetical protein F5880DRAFT_1616443 [Lentinula raphanica]
MLQDSQHNQENNDHKCDGLSEPLRTYPDTLLIPRFYVFIARHSRVLALSACLRAQGSPLGSIRYGTKKVGKSRLLNFLGKGKLQSGTEKHTSIGSISSTTPSSSNKAPISNSDRVLAEQIRADAFYKQLRNLRKQHKRSESARVDLLARIRELEKQLLGQGPTTSAFIESLQKDLIDARAQIHQLDQELHHEQEKLRTEKIRAQNLARLRDNSRQCIARIPKRLEDVAGKAVEALTHQSMKNKNVVTPEMRLCIMDLVSDGAPADKVNSMIHAVGKALGIDLVDDISDRTTRRVVRSAGIASRLQVVEAIQNSPSASISGDGTSHKNLNYESRHTAVIDPVTGKKSIYFLGIGIALAPDHTSEEQLNGWTATVHEMYQSYQATPQGQQTPLTVHDFYKKVLGMITDHAADQKKLANLFTELKKSMEREERGERAIKNVAPEILIQTITEFNIAKITAVGGPSTWDALSSEEKERRNEETYRSVLRHYGEQDFQKLTPEQQAEADFFIWCGCCMHKDLNAHKGATARMAEYWEESGKTPPLILMNKDNAAAAEIGNAAAKKRAEQVSARGGIKLTELMGLLLKNTNSKKGQQDRHGIYFEAREHLGFFTHFPDTSNTRYQSHCDGAAEIMVHLPIYRELLEFIRDEKQSVKFNHLEYNIYQALYDIPTLTELAGHTLYGQAVTYPYLRVVRSANANHLDLGPIHESLIVHVQNIFHHPELLCGSDSSYLTASLDGKPWERPEAVYAVLAMSSQLPDLIGIVKYLFEGALATWKRFAAEVTDRSLNDGLSSRLYIPGTNDANESGLSDLPQWDSELERAEEAQGNGKKRRKLIADTSQQKVAVTRAKRAQTQKKKDEKNARLKRCKPLTDVSLMSDLLDGLRKNPRGRFPNDIKISDLDLQLDWHRDRERRSGKEVSIGPTSKIGNKIAKLELLIRVVEAWNDERGTNEAYESVSEEDEQNGGEESVEEDSEEELIGFTRD